MSPIRLRPLIPHEIIMNRSTSTLLLTAAFAMLASQATLARAGDFNHDGFDDLAIGVPGETVGNTRGGAVAVIYGSSSGLNATAPPDQIFSQDTPGMPGTVEIGDDFGLSLTTGDFDGDGFDDLAIGVPDEDIGNTVDAGVVMVIFGGPNGLSTTPRTAQSFNAVAPLASAQFGRSLACDDFDHDGFDDLAIGVPGEKVGTSLKAGSVNVLFGSPQGLTVNRRQILTQNTPGVADSAETNDFFGFALAAG